MLSSGYLRVSYLGKRCPESRGTGLGGFRGVPGPYLTLISHENELGPSPSFRDREPAVLAC